jgi:hypothetical protein
MIEMDQKEQLDSILEAGRLAPTAKNLQEQHVYVVQSDKRYPIYIDYNWHADSMRKMLYYIKEWLI